MLQEVFERRKSTGSGLLASLSSGFAQLSGKSSLRVKTLNNPNLAASRQIKTEKALLPVGVRRSKTPLLKFPISAHWPGMCKTVTSPQFRFLPQSPPKCVANRPLDEG